MRTPPTEAGYLITVVTPLARYLFLFLTSITIGWVKQANPTSSQRGHRCLSDENSFFLCLLSGVASVIFLSEPLSSCGQSDIQSMCLIKTVTSRTWSLFRFEQYVMFMNRRATREEQAYWFPPAQLYSNDSPVLEVWRVLWECHGHGFSSRYHLDKNIFGGRCCSFSLQRWINDALNDEVLFGPLYQIL